MSINYSYPISIPSLTVGNINLTGDLMSSSGTSLINSQWLTTQANLSYTSGSVVIGTALSTGNIISLNSSLGTINSDGLTTGNINFTGNLFQNGVAYIGSQWTTTSSNLSYTSGSVVIETTLSAGTLISTTSTIGNIVAITGISSGIYVGNSISVGNINSVDTSSGTYVGNSISVGNINSILATIGTLRSSDIFVTGTLTSVNITTQNLLQSSGTLIANNIETSSFITTSFASLSYNSNTVGNIYTTGGNVGINTITPIFTLDVNGPSRLFTDVITNTIASLMVGGPNANGNTASLQTTGSTALFYGNGGITNVDLSTFISTIGGGNGLPGCRISLTDLGSYNNSFNLLTKNVGGSNTMSSRLFIDGSGSIGINTTIPSAILSIFNTNGNNLLLQSGNASTSATLTLTTPTLTGYIGLGGGSVSVTNYINNLFYQSPNNHIWNYNTTSVMSLTNSGTLTVIGDIGAFGTISDARLKTNVNKIIEGLSIVNELNPVTFNWKDDLFNEHYAGKNDSGFIAQEVEEILPHAVGEYTNIGNNFKYKNMRHERIIPYLVSAIQELTKKVNYLESK